MNAEASNFWSKCSTCKKPIGFSQSYYVCSVSTCNGQRTGYIFCSITCFEAHVPGARHRDAAAIEKQAPKSMDTHIPARIIINQAPASTLQSPRQQVPKEVLVIASRIKDYIQAQSEFNTSAGVMDELSEHLRLVLERGIENAKAAGRKTVMDRDFDFLKHLK